MTIFCRTFILLTLISEASSTMFDFVALDKIGIIFVVPSASLQHPDGASLLDEDPQHFLEGAFAPRREAQRWRYLWRTSPGNCMRALL
jgi:hypothetical protein